MTGTPAIPAAEPTGKPSERPAHRDPNVLHNVAIFSDAQYTHREFTGDVFAGPETMRYRFRALDAGTYYFRCDMHPTSMLGEIHVEKKVHHEEEPNAGEEPHAE